MSIHFYTILFLCCCSVAWATDRAGDRSPLAMNDARFRPVQPAAAEYIPKVLPAQIPATEFTFWQHRIGSDDASPLIIATLNDGKRVWVDAERQGTWTEAELVEQASTCQWFATIRAQPDAGRTDTWPASDAVEICLQRQSDFGFWMLASLVQLDGELEVGDQKTKYRLLDMNSDGKLEGIDDTLQLDHNKDGKFDRLRESYPLSRSFTVRGKRYSLRLDREARSVGVQAFDLTGAIQLSFDGWERFDQPPSRYHVVLQSDSGVQVVFTNNQPQTVPIGKYHVYAATLYWDGDEKWRMTFARWDSPNKSTHRVESNQTTNIAVLGKIELTASLESLADSSDGYRAVIQPALKSESGLYLTRASSGSLDPTIDGTLIAIVQRDDTKTSLTTGSTQFACGTFCPIQLSWKGSPASSINLSFDSGPLAGVLTGQVEMRK